MTDQPINLLRRVSAALRAGEPLLSEDAATIAAALGEFLAGKVRSLDEALGLRLGPGQRDPRTTDALRQRDDLLRDAAARLRPDLSITGRAEFLHRALDRYHTTGWPNHQGATECPPTIAGTLHELFWRGLKVRDDVPSARAIRRVLATSSQYSWPAFTAPDSDEPPMAALSSEHERGA